jgi:hypothetical protein
VDRSLVHRLLAMGAEVRMSKLRLNKEDLAEFGAGLRAAPFVAVRAFLSAMYVRPVKEDCEHAVAAGESKTATAATATPLAASSPIHNAFRRLGAVSGRAIARHILGFAAMLPSARSGRAAVAGVSVSARALQQLSAQRGGCAAIACTACTLLNPPENVVCEACTTWLPKPAASGLGL